jgi:hypothetical protein
MADSLDPRAAALRRKMAMTRSAEDLSVLRSAGDPNRGLVRGRLLDAAQRVRWVHEPVRRQAVRQIFKEHLRAVITHEVTGPVLSHVDILKAAYLAPEDYWHTELDRPWNERKLAGWLADFYVAAGERGRNDRQQQILSVFQRCPVNPAVYSKLAIFWLADNRNTWKPWTLLSYIAHQPAVTAPPATAWQSKLSIDVDTAPPRAPKPTTAPGEGNAPLGELPTLDAVINAHVERKIRELIPNPGSGTDSGDYGNDPADGDKGGDPIGEAAKSAYRPAANSPVNVGAVSSASKHRIEPIEPAPEHQGPLPDKEARALRESVIRGIKGAGKIPGSKDYSWDQFVGEVKRRCRAREELRGFSRTNLWRMYNE